MPNIWCLFFGQVAQHEGSVGFPNQLWNPGPLQAEVWSASTGLPGSPLISELLPEPHGDFHDSKYILKKQLIKISNVTQKNGGTGHILWMLAHVVCFSQILMLKPQLN